MSGAIEDVRVQDISAINSQSGIRITTAVGTGAFVKSIHARRMAMHTMKYVFWMSGNYTSRPDSDYGPKALPVIQAINYRDMTAENVAIAADLRGIEGDAFTGICISNVSIIGISSSSKTMPWNCSNIKEKVLLQAV
ncbi:probable polygalacturonase [Diospyros lotus]|uniref:probable polygalacturonase n=1 Tax=Diospyros lotus TaxID=55363 RepID=UPI002258AA46|nr:probable polygalacturonase [Diospyros lotus]